MSHVDIQGYGKSYGSHTVVADVDLRIEEGEFVTFLGPSGCGKTTILRSICGLSAPTQGTIHIGDRLVDDPANGVFVPPNKRGLGMVFQSYALWPHMTVAGNVAYPLQARRRPKSQIRDRVDQALARVGLAGYGSRQVSDLSGGQQQRVAFARALVDEPRVILLDEPLSNLDTRLRSDLRQELRDLHRELGTTSVFVTHDQVEALTLSDRVVVLDHGQLVQHGTPEQVFATPANHFVADFLGYENILAGHVLRSDPEGALVHVPGLGQEIVTRLSAPVADETAVEVAVRASSVLLEPCVSGEACAADSHAVIEDITYMGDVLDCSLRAEATSLLARVNARQPGIRVGARVHGAIAAHAAVAFAANPDPQMTGATPSAAAGVNDGASAEADAQKLAS